MIRLGMHGCLDAVRIWQEFDVAAKMLVGGSTWVNSLITKDFKVFPCTVKRF